MSITAFIGENGDGKTLGAMAYHAIPALNRGRPVASTLDIFAPGTTEPHPLSIKITEWRQLLDLAHCTLILDEISGQFPSRGSMSLPPELLRLVHQLRKPDVDLVWTGVNWARADVALREATKRVTLCTGRIRDKWEREQKVPSILHAYAPKLKGPDGKPLRRDQTWESMSLFTYTTYRANAFDEFSIHAIQKLRPLKRNYYWRPWHHADKLYDTLQQVPLLDNVSETGTCINCGGQKRRPQCTCTQPRPPRHRAPAAAGEEQEL